jgi:hypothetical protein
LIAACTYEELEGLNDGPLDRFKAVYFYDQFGCLHPSENKLFISYVVCSGIDPGFRWKVPEGFGALPSRFKVAWLAGFGRSAVFFLPDCTEVVAEENCPFVRRLPGADSRFDAPEDLSLKLLFQLDGEQSSDGEPFDYRESDSIRDLTAKLSVCSIAETGFYLINATGSGKRVRKILWRRRTKLNGTLSSGDSHLRSKSSRFSLGGLFKESA